MSVTVKSNAAKLPVRVPSPPRNVPVAQEPIPEIASVTDSRYPLSFGLKLSCMCHLFLVEFLPSYLLVYTIPAFSCLSLHKLCDEE